MPPTARPAAPAVEPCSREEHEQLKRDAREFRRLTRYVGVQGRGKMAPELRNCTRCGSTLTAPRGKRRGSATAAR
jgi:hypothetical protein